jgi:hydrogenase-4 component E
VGPTLKNEVIVSFAELPFAKIANLLAFIFLLMSFLLLIRNSLAAQVRMFAAQSGVLSALAAVVAYFSGNRELFGVAVAFAVIKVVVIPKVLNRAVTNIGLQRAVAPYLGTSMTLVICGGLVVVAFYVMAPVTASNRLPTADGIPLAFAGVLIGLFTTVNRRRALTQILGFLMLENSIFMIALLATYGVPLIVEMGVFLDVLVAVLILEVFVYRIKENFESIDVKHLGSLRG